MAGDEQAQAQVQRLDVLGFPLHGTRLIEASAGTGKTYTLALLYARLVLGHGDDGSAFGPPLMPPQILVVTFTEAATQELRERIRARLVEAADLFERSTAPAAEPEGDPLEALRDSYPAERWQGCARQLRRAAEWMDEAMIATIHGWCQRMLQEHAFATRGLFQRELVTDQTDLVAEILRDYWRLHFYPLAPEQARCIQAIVASPAALRQKLDSWLRRRDAALSYRGEPLQAQDLAEPLAAQCRWQTETKAVEAQRAAIDDEQVQLEQRAREQWRADRSALEDYLRGLRPHLNGQQHASVRTEQFDELLAQIGDWAEAGAAAPGKLKNFAQGAFRFKKAAPVQAEQPHPAFAAIAAWQGAQRHKPELPKPPEPGLDACLFAHAAAWISAELPRRLRTRAEMGFDDLLHELEAALRPADGSAAAREQAQALAARIRDQFPVALIDEFQDTDPIQYRIFAAIYGVPRETQATPGRRTAMVMIGDPKQAIYGFRGADIHAYLAARRASSGRLYSLGRNFRSSEELVEACNQLFSHAEQHARGAFRFRDGSENPIPYLNVDAKGRDERLISNGQPAPPVTFWQLDSGAEPVSPDTYRSQMAEAAASEVLRWLQPGPADSMGFETSAGWRPIRPEDIAILVRSGQEAAAMRAALAARCINSVYLSDRDSVFATEEASDLLHWLNACAAPTDEGLVRAALGTNTLALPLQDLAALQQDELAWEAEIERFRAYRQTWQRQGVLAMLRRLMHEADLPARLLTRANGERILTNLLHLSEWLQQAATALDGERALIRHLSEHLEQRGDEFIVRLESDAELVQVITIHKSKGLEYPLVLLPFICSWYQVDGRTGQVPYRMAPTADALNRYLEVAGKKRFPAAWDAADDERLSEDMRLLYVALTRARHAVWLGIAALKSGNASRPQLERSAIGHLLNGGECCATPQAVWEALERLKAGCEAIAITAAPEIQQGRLRAETDLQLEPARTPSHPRFTPWWIGSYSALHQGAGAGGAPPLEDSGAETAAQETTREESALGDADALSARPVVSSRSGGIMHDFPRGSRYGTFLHGLLEWAASQHCQGEDGALVQGYAAALHPAVQRRDMLARRCALRGLGDWVDALDVWLQDLLTQRWVLTGLEAPLTDSTPAAPATAGPLQLGGAPVDPERDEGRDALPGLSGYRRGPPDQPDQPGASDADLRVAAPTFRLQDLAPQQIQVEMEFWIESRRVDTEALDRLLRAHCLPGRPRPELRPNQLNGLLKGFIDLVFEHQGRYYLLDWKSNWLGPDDDAYSREAMAAAVLEHRYDLQYALYLLALHRLLRARLPGYDYDRHLGGAIYLFLRASHAPSQGLFTDKPASALIEALDRLFAGESVAENQEAA